MDVCSECQCGFAFKQNHDLRSLLFSVLLISCQIPPANTKIYPVKDMMTVEQGDEAILSFIADGNVMEISWYREQSIPSNLILKMSSNIPVQKGPKYTKKESILPDYSLRIMNASINDSGLYTVHIMTSHLFYTLGELVEESTTLRVEVYNRSLFPFGTTITCIIFIIPSIMLLILFMTGLFLYWRRRQRQTATFDGVTVVDCIYDPHTCYENAEHEMKKEDQPLNTSCRTATYMKIHVPEQSLYMHLERQGASIENKEQFIARLENIWLQIQRNNTD
ncbi:uncharacterized protein LOC122809296 [Protopterus annectens]|uniref:uncharacterized protein LOC122809296 n=1 Tax=Protopterus annectens TaxID=7888 RepID=UPI001CFBA58C|nr:uncharacterized protein LOC122809296 [Protopterus annectens]